MKGSIQEGIREELAKRRYYDGMVGVGSGIPRWEDRTEVEREHFRAKVDSDFHYLHSQGVVKIVDRELPQLFVFDPTQTNENWAMFRRATREDMAGYVAVEPLRGKT